MAQGNLFPSNTDTKERKSVLAWPGKREPGLVYEFVRIIEVTFQRLLARGIMPLLERSSLIQHYLATSIQARQLPRRDASRGLLI
jgi:hypothetical protein